MHVYTCVLIHVCARVHACVCACMCVPVYASLCMSVHVCVAAFNNNQQWGQGEGLAGQRVAAQAREPEDGSPEPGSR